MNNILLETQEKPSNDVVQNDLINLTSIPITDENTALNMLVQFVNLAQKRGAFNIQESAKIWECVSKFIKNE
jgi:hypothetical protein